MREILIYIENAKSRIRLNAGEDVESVERRNAAIYDLRVHELALQSLSQEAVRDEALEEMPSYENIAEMLPSILSNASAQCPLCGQYGVHQHTPQEIIIYRNGVKYGAHAMSMTDDGPAPAAPDVGSWLIWSNEHEAWWGHDRCGYPHDITKAGRYSFDEARAICRQRHWGDRRPPEVMICERDIPARSLR